MKKDELNFIEVPENGTRRNGIIVSVDEGSHVVLFISHQDVVVIAENGDESEMVIAYPIRVEKPVTRDRAINQAEMQAYNLISALDVASFGTALSRKFREDPEDEEVRDHDEFIGWVKEELTKIGL